MMRVLGFAQRASYTIKEKWLQNMAVGHTLLPLNGFFKLIKSMNEKLTNLVAKIDTLKQGIRGRLNKNDSPLIKLE